MFALQMHTVAARQGEEGKVLRAEVVIKRRRIRDGNATLMAAQAPSEFDGPCGLTSR